MTFFDGEALLSYDMETVARFRRAINWVDAAFKAFKGGLREETSPVQIFPHHLDLAMNWFSGRLVPGVDPADAENADEQMNFGLATDDYQIQSIVQTSPPKWQIAHVSWLFEAFVLPRFVPGYQPFDPRCDFLFKTPMELNPQFSHRGFFDRANTFRRHAEALRQFLQCLLLFRQPALPEDSLTALVETGQGGVESLVLVRLAVFALQHGGGLHSRILSRFSLYS